MMFAMPTESIVVCGSYRYLSHGDLELAIVAARERIEEDDHATMEPDWLQTFVRRGTTLRVETTIPMAADRFLASAVLDALACRAVEGVVEVRAGGRCLDWFPSGQADT
jgi:hypothetical protein